MNKYIRKLLLNKKTFKCLFLLTIIFYGEFCNYLMQVCPSTAVLQNFMHPVCTADFSCHLLICHHRCHARGSSKYFGSGR